MSVCNENNPHTHRLVGTAAPTSLGMSGALDDAKSFAANVDLEELTKYQFLIVVEELITNIVSHGRPAPDSTIEYQYARHGDAVRISLTDSGVAFDPRAMPEFSPDAAIDEGQEGGWGWPVIFRWCELESYCRNDDRNQIVLVMRTML
jgi:anti-sigma regulatory factor (Ser/Thr protein kinase)